MGEKISLSFYIYLFLLPENPSKFKFLTLISPNFSKFVPL